MLLILLVLAGFAFVQTDSQKSDLSQMMGLRGKAKFDQKTQFKKVFPESCEFEMEEDEQVLHNFGTALFSNVQSIPIEKRKLLVGYRNNAVFPLLKQNRQLSDPSPPV